MTVRLAVFDCDGTLVDSQVNIVRAMTDCFADTGREPPTAEAVKRLVGLSLVEVMRGLLPDATPHDHTALAATYKLAFQRLRASPGFDPEPLYPGVAAGLAELHAAGWTLGVATGKSDRGLAHVLSHHDVTALFTTLHTADRHPSKPHPAMLRAAMADAGAAACDTVMIGDTVFDIAMARNAGVRGIGVDWGYHDTHELQDAGASDVVTTMPALLAALARENA